MNAAGEDDKTALMHARAENGLIEGRDHSERGADVNKVDGYWERTVSVRRQRKATWRS